VARALLLACVCLAVASSGAEARRRKGKKAPEQPTPVASAPAETQPGTAPDGGAAEPAETQPGSGSETQPGTVSQGVQLSPEESDRLARDHFEKGRHDYDEGNYRDAWDHFHQAYGLSDRPELLYNIGQTADRLGRDQDALDAFRLYLERNPDADNRREVENRIRALEDRVKQDGGAGAAAAASEDAPAAPPRPQPTREGFYLRLGLGMGFLVNPRSSVGLSSTVAGASTGSEVWIGHSVLRGLALGGGLYFDIAFKATGSVDGGSTGATTATGTSVDEGALRLSMFGGGADWYPLPDRNGMHFQAAIALARLNSAGLSSGGPTGGAILLGGGYEWPIAREWGIGVLGRLTLAALSDEGIDYKVLAMSIQFSATWF